MAADCDSSAVEGHGRSLQEVGFQWHRFEDHGVSRSDRCKRLVQGESRSWRDGRRNALQGGRIAAERSGLEAQACCSRASRWMCVAGATTGRASAQPGPCQRRTPHYFLSATRTCSGSACAGSLSGLKPLLYAIVCGEGRRGRREWGWRGVVARQVGDTKRADFKAAA